MNTNNIVLLPNIAYRPSASRAIRFDALHPGSTFRIEAEPSRGIKKVRDGRVYRKDRNGFFSVDTITGAGVVLMPHDLVMPVVKDKEAMTKLKQGKHPNAKQHETPHAVDNKQKAAV